MTLHDRIRAVVEKRLAVARAATPGPWFVFADPVDPVIGDMYWVHSSARGPVTQDFDTGGVAIERTEHRHGRADAEHIAANDPADAILSAVTALSVLERHWAPDDGEEYIGLCKGCADPFPCPDALALATRWRVEVDG